MRQTRDARGNVVRERYFDENAASTLGADGYHTVEIGYDARDNPISYRYLDLDGAPTTVKQSYQWRRLTYDGDRLIRTEYFDKDDKPAVWVAMPQSRAARTPKADWARARVAD